MDDRRALTAVLGDRQALDDDRQALDDNRQALDHDRLSVAGRRPTSRRPFDKSSGLQALDVGR